MKKSVAIIGMSVNLPKKINTLAGFWDLITSGKDLSDEYPEYRRDEVTKYIRFRKQRALKNVGGERASFHNGCFLDNSEMFDSRFFNLTPMQAKTMDPHHRLILKTLYHAVEDAGYAGERISGTKTGVYIGFACNPGQDYSAYLMDIDPDLSQVALTGNVPCMLANRISHFLNLKGPSMVVDTACSASLVASYQAAQAISDGKITQALVAGARLCTPINDPSGRIGIESSDGKTRTFDVDADGTGLGEGSGAVMLKDLDAAIRDKDNIYAVIRGGAVNHDGTTDGITTPDSDSQAQLLSDAWRDANIQASDLDFLEAHGTATKIGDPIEVTGMRNAFDKGQYDKKKQCAIGTVKTNIGHLFEGSGVMGLIKTTLSLKHHTIPKLANYERSNPLLDLDDSPFYVAQDNLAIEGKDRNNIAGISAFGLGGTNCHLVLESFDGNFDVQPDEKAQEPTAQPYPFLLSANSVASIKAQIQSFLDFLDKNVEDPQLSLKDICFTLAKGRKHMRYRAATLATSKSALKNLLSELDFVDIEAHKEVPTLEENKSSPCANLVNEYLAGGELDIAGVFPSTCRYISLPSYCYDEQDCFYYFPEHATLIPRNFSSDGLQTYQVNYVEKSINPRQISKTNEKVLIFDAEGSERSAQLAKIETLKGNEVTILKLSTRAPNGLTENDGEILLENEEANYARLCDIIREKQVSHIIHITKASSLPENSQALRDQVRLKLKSLFFLSKNLIAASIKCRLTVLTENANRIDQGPAVELCPENSAVLGFARVIPRESPFIKVKCLDLSPSTHTRFASLELSASEEERLVIYRNGARYIEEFEYVDVVSSRFSGIKLREDDVYVITGGTGSIGIEVAKRFAQENLCRIILLSRSGLPERDTWDSQHNLSEKAKTCIESIRDIESTGSSVEVLRCDAGDPEALSAAIDRIHQRYGKIKGVVHAAGVPGQNIISMRKDSDFDEVIDPKIIGTFAITQMVEKVGIEFIALFSSVAAIFPTAGQGDYAAGNCYMDTIADSFLHGKTRVVSMQWAAWRDIGMAVDFNTNQDTTFKAIPTKIGIGCLFDGIMHTPARIFVGEINYANPIVDALRRLGIKMSNDIALKIETSLSSDSEESPQGAGSSNAEKIEVSLSGRESGQYSDTELAVAQVWSDALGYESFSIQDKFISLGGESITAMTIARNIDEALDVQIDVSDILQHPTIEELASLIDDKKTNVKVA